MLSADYPDPRGLASCIFGMKWSTLESGQTFKTYRRNYLALHRYREEVIIGDNLIESGR